MTGERDDEMQPVQAAGDVTARIAAEDEAIRELQPGDMSAAAPASAGRGLLGSSAVMAAGTVTSRLTGVLRDVAMTAALGFYLVSDAYSLGNTLPNIVYILIAGGALNAVFIPQLVRRMKDDADGGTAYLDRLLTLVMTVLVALTVAAVILAPLIVDLYATSAYGPGQRDLAVAFARLCLPQILFYGAYAMLSQVLNSRGRFGPPMFAPIANNIVAIATFLLFLAIAGTSAAADGVLTPDQIAILGIGTTLGVVAQSAILIPVLWKAGYIWRPRFDWRGVGLRKTGTLALWTIGLVMVNQAAYVIITRLATLANVNAAAGDTVAAGLTTYQKAHLVFILPHSVITVSVVTAMLPALSRLAHSGHLVEVGQDIGRVMRNVAALIIPIGTVLLLVSPSLSILLFGYGASTVAQAELTGIVVAMFTVGLVPFTLFYVLLRGFYALEDTRTPFWVSALFNGLMLLFAVPLFYAASRIVGGGGPQVAALALGYSLAYWLVFAVTWWLLARRLGTLDSRRTLGALARMLAAATVAFGVMYAAQRGLALIPLSLGPWGSALVRIVILSGVGAASYGACAALFKVTEVSDAITMLRRRLRRS